MPSELPFTVSYRLITACNAATTGYEAVLTRLVGKPAKPTLAWEDYDHIGADRDFVAALLEGAAKRREKGVNILVYGPPGTGKTEFCKTVVGRLGLNLYAVADDDGRGNEPSRDERIAQIRMSESVLTGVKSATLLFDEMEDLLSSGGGFTGGGLSEVRMGGSKAFVNRMLELNRIPVFWTSNTIRAFDPAFLRRMTFALEIKAPNAAESERVLSKVLSDERVAAEPHEIRRIAREFSPAPAIAASAAKAARLSNGEISGVRRAIRAAQKAMRGGYEHPPRLVTEHRYDPRLLAANLDLAALADKLCAPGVARNYSLCLYGPPGTGKTAFVRHLTERLDMALMHKRASDLMSCYVGGTERNIAGTFADARDSQSFLVIDEADSFLRDRSDAVRSWEVTQVNEMLTWMECHPLPFACTTNLMQSIDRAALRRFTFKVHLDYLRPSQIVEAFRLFFNLEAPKATVKLPVLTPGDFAVVARKARFLGEIDDAAALARMLDEECEAKPDWPRQIGFAA